MIANNSAELVMFALVALLVSALRDRLRVEVHLRMSAIDELRHSDRLNTLGKLTSGLAHEVGTPLKVISWRAELIESGALGDDEVRSSAGIITKQTEKMTRIVRNLLVSRERARPSERCNRYASSSTTLSSSCARSPSAWASPWWPKGGMSRPR